MDIKNKTMTDKNIQIQSELRLPESFGDVRRNHGGQSVPQDFFSEFEKKMNAAIDAQILLDQAEKKNSQPRIQWYRQKRTWMSLAASFVLIVVLGIAFQFDRLGHILSDEAANNTTEVANTQYTDDEEFFDVPEVVEERYLATTNDYELYEFFCEI